MMPYYQKNIGATCTWVLISPDLHGLYPKT